MKGKPTLLYYTTFAATIFLSAFLLFQVQPIIGKYILPWFGGTSFVWITTLLFFQTLLLCGYLYAYLLTKLSLKNQLYLHTAVVFAIMMTTVFLFFQWSSPITPGVALKLSGNISPALQVLAILLVSVGLPYFLLSTTSTLLQKWFSELPHKKSPYPLYALSNTGSLLAIISYPFFIEPFLSIQTQGYTWSVAFIVLCLLLILCSIQLYVIARNRPMTEATPQTSTPKLNSRRGLLWLFLPAVSSLMLLAGTHQLTQGIAPIPFLWLLPLGLYLLSFILCFSERSFYKRNFYAYCFLLCVPFVIAILIQPPVLGIFSELFLFTILLFSSFMICHGELFSKRPDTQQLNAFYLLMALGSVVGAIVVAIIAPIFFVGLFWEFLLGLYFLSLIAVFALVTYKNSFLYRRLKFGLRTQKEIKIFILCVVSVFFIILAAGSYKEQTYETIGIWRNFYGTLRVVQQSQGTIRCLLNGKIIHGCQPLATSQKMKPTTYFGENSVGIAVQSLREKNNSKKKNLTIGVIGLGVGTIAAYGKKGDVITFYELNPLDVKIAKKDFTYLTDTPARIETIVGDGRLSMEQELHTGKVQKYNLFVVDAFNDDSIPVHLLTKEAFALYLAQLAPDGIIAVHISNTYLDLAPVIAKVAAYHHMNVLFVNAPPANDNQTRSKWAFLTQDKDLFTSQAFKKAKKDTTAIKDIRLWTDDYSNLFQLLKY